MKGGQTQKVVGETAEVLASVIWAPESRDFQKSWFQVEVVYMLVDHFSEITRMLVHSRQKNIKMVT